MSDRRKVLVAVAWPYANGFQHIGHLAGCYLPSDIFARYQRMIGSDVLMVSGSDTHGTPVTVKADQEGITPKEVVNRYHQKFIETYQQIGLTFDLFTMTHTQNHRETVQQLFKDHLEKEYIYSDDSEQLFDPKAGRFLPDRYVEGECPHCGSDGARGDQCDHCGKTYDAVELKNPVSKMTGSRDLEVRTTTHFYLDLGKLNAPLCDWVNDGKKHWRSTVLNFTKSEVDKHELRGRAITRDLEWGIPIPLDGYDDKRIYVWYEAVIGYLSASKEWSKITGNPDHWKEWLSIDTNPEAKTYYFIGKDNITFHTVIWPAMLLASGGLNLPYDVPANEHLNSYGKKFSKSKGISIDVADVLEKYQSDAWRYALTVMAPESSDVNFTWTDFIEKVNNELVANWGNLCNRILGFTYKKFDTKIPKPAQLDNEDIALLDEVKSGFENVGELYERVKIKAALEETRRLCQRVNQYLNDKAPWTLIKTDEKAAATACYVSLQCIDWLKTMWAPILPKSSQLIHETLGYEGQMSGRQYTEVIFDDMGEHEVLRYDHSQAVGEWLPSTLNVGQQMLNPKPPYIKLDPKDFELVGPE